MKTNPLSLLTITLLISFGGTTSASEQAANRFSAFTCVRDLMAITGAAAFQSKRDQVERPFMASNDFMVFPEVTGLTVTGFYIYSEDRANYYDTVQAKLLPTGKPRLLSEISASSGGTHVMFELVAQPVGLETVTLLYMPGFGADRTTANGPVVLGASVLPVVGAFVSRPAAPLRQVYYDPRTVSDHDLKEWVYKQATDKLAADKPSTRKPSAVDEVQVPHQMMQLLTARPKSGDDLWKPLKAELALRKAWIQAHNLNESSFKSLSRLLQTSCKEFNPDLQFDRSK